MQGRIDHALYMYVMNDLAAILDNRGQEVFCIHKAIRTVQTNHRYTLKQGD